LLKCQRKNTFVWLYGEGFSLQSREINIQRIIMKEEKVLIR
jgi:hypothetical protein